MMKGLMPREPVCGALLTGCVFGVLLKWHVEAVANHHELMLLEMEE